MKEKTHFAPASRTSSAQILKENEFVASQKQFAEISGAMSGIIIVIDNNRQIIYSNNDFLDLLGLKTMYPILGLRQ